MANAQLLQYAEKLTALLELQTWLSQPEIQNDINRFAVGSHVKLRDTTSGSKSRNSAAAS